MYILDVAESNFTSDLRGYFLFPGTRSSAHVPLVSLIFRAITMQRNVTSPTCRPAVSRTSIVLCVFGHANRMRYYCHYYHHCVIITIIRIRNIIIVIFERERRRWQHAIAGARRQGWGHRRISCTGWLYFSIANTSFHRRFFSFRLKLPHLWNRIWFSKNIINLFFHWYDYYVDDSVKYIKRSTVSISNIQQKMVSWSCRPVNIFTISILRP